MTSLMGPSSYINLTPFLSCHFIRHDLIEEVVHPFINAMGKKTQYKIGRVLETETYTGSDEDMTKSKGKDPLE